MRCCAPSHRPGSCSCRGSARRRSVKRCDESSPASARIACCARWASSSIATTERRPLLLVTEDLHWSDRATIQLIDYIARRRGNARLMWLASFRLTEVVALDHPLNPLRHELRLHDLCEEIVLDPFSESEVADYVAERSPAIATDEAFVRALHERTDGLPLFVASITSEMSARAAQGGGRVAPEQVAKIAVPENLAAIIEHYIAKLESEQRTVALGGRRLRRPVPRQYDRGRARAGRRLGLVTSATSSRASSYGSSARAPRKAAAWQSRPYSFRHALFRQVLYERTAASSPCTASPKNRRRARTRARRRSAGHRGRVGHAFRASRRGNGCRALLRRSRRSRSCALQPGRVHEDHRTCVAAARAGAGRFRAQRTANHHRNASRSCRYPSARRGRRSKERAPASVLAARRSSAASDAWAACCTDSGGCFACARNMPRRSRSPIGRKRLDRRRTIRCFCRPRAPFMGRSISFRVDRRPPGHGSSAGSRLPSGWTSVPENSWWIRRSRCSACSPTHSLHLGLVEQARACVQRAYARARDRGWPMARLVAIWHGALLEVRLGNAERVAALAR